jgi:hypothetical protein
MELLRKCVYQLHIPCRSEAYENFFIEKLINSSDIRYPSHEKRNLCNIVNQHVYTRRGCNGFHYALCKNKNFHSKKIMSVKSATNIRAKAIGQFPFGPIDGRRSINRHSSLLIMSILQKNMRIVGQRKALFMGERSSNITFSSEC